MCLALTQGRCLNSHLRHHVAVLGHSRHKNNCARSSSVMAVEHGRYANRGVRGTMWRGWHKATLPPIGSGTQQVCIQKCQHYFRESEWACLCHFMVVIEPAGLRTGMFVLSCDGDRMRFECKHGCLQCHMVMQGHGRHEKRHVQGAT